MTNSAIATRLRAEAARRERTTSDGASQYRARAWRHAADSVAMFPEPIDLLYRQHRLTDVPGIGQAIGAFIARLVDPD